MCASVSPPLVAATENVKRRRKLQPTDRLVVAASDFYGGFCKVPGEDEESARIQPDQSDLPKMLMTRALRWCTELMPSGLAQSRQGLPNLTEIPTADANWLEIANFALTFDGYDYCGSFEKCSELAKRVRKLIEVSRECSLLMSEARVACSLSSARHVGWKSSQKVNGSTMSRRSCREYEKPSLRIGVL